MWYGALVVVYSHKHAYNHKNNFYPDTLERKGVDSGDPAHNIPRAMICVHFRLTCPQEDVITLE